MCWLVIPPPFADRLVDLLLLFLQSSNTFPIFSIEPERRRTANLSRSSSTKTISVVLQSPYYWHQHCVSMCEVTTNKQANNHHCTKQTPKLGIPCTMNDVHCTYVRWERANTRCTFTTHHFRYRNIYSAKSVPWEKLPMHVWQSQSLTISKFLLREKCREVAKVFRTGDHESIAQQ